MGWISRQFTTRTIVLMPIAIAINIVLGVTVQQVLKLPIYLDSIGTILVGVVAGPIAGLLTGALSNLIWGYLLPAPIGSSTIGPFAITAAVIGLLAGFWGWLGSVPLPAGRAGLDPRRDRCRRPRRRPRPVHVQPRLCQPDRLPEQHGLRSEHAR